MLGPGMGGKGMDDERDQGIGAPVVMGLAAAAAFGFALYTLIPRVNLALAHTTPAGRLFGEVALTGLAIGLVAGIIGWLVAAAVTRSAMLPGGPVFVLLLAAGVTVVSVSTAGWVQTITTFNHLFTTAGGHRAYHPARLGTLPEYRRQMALDKEAYVNELRALEYPRFLAPPAIATPDGRENAHSKIILARAVVAKYRALYTVRVAALKDSFAHGDDAKRLDHALTPESTARLDWWKAVDEVMAEQQAALDDLTIPKAPWEVKEGKLLFHAKADADAFQTHVDALKALQEKAHKLDLAIAHASDTTDEEMLGMKN